MKKRRLFAALSRITLTIHCWPRRPCVLWDRRLIIPLIPAMVSAAPRTLISPETYSLQPSPSPEVPTPPNVRAHLNTQSSPRAVGRRWATTRGGGRAGAGRRCRAHRLPAARRAAARAVGSTFGAELSQGWLEDFCTDLDSSTADLGSGHGEIDLDVTLRVVGPGEGRRNYENSCSLYDGSTEALFDTNLLSDAEARFIVAGNVIRVCKLRPSGPTAGAVTQNEYGEYDCRGRVALLRISLVSGAPDEKWRPNEVPKGPTPSLPKLAPGNVDALCAGGGGESSCASWTSGARVARRTGGASSFPTASLPRVASRPAALMPAASRRSPCVSSRRAGQRGIRRRDDHRAQVAHGRGSAAAAARNGADRRRLCERRFRRRRRAGRGDAGEKAPTMRQANLLSPDHGKRTFFVSESPTGVEDFPKVSLRRREQDRLAELAEDAAAFAGAPTAAAARAFTRRASLLREVCGTSNASAARRSLDAVVPSRCCAQVSSPAQTRSRPPPPRPCAICRAPRRRACPRRRSTACSTTCYAGSAPSGPRTPLHRPPSRPRC